MKRFLLRSIILLAFTLPAYAEAPVYDADAMPQQFESDLGDQAAADPQADLPPPTEQEAAGTFVPMRPERLHAAAGNNAGTTTEVLSPASTESMTVGERLKRIEMQLNNLQNNEVTARTDSLQTQVQSLRDQVEKLTHQLQQMQDQQKGIYAEVEKKLAQQNTIKPAPASAESASGAAEKSKPASKSTLAAKLFGKSNDSATESKPQSQPQVQPNVAEEQQIYQTAYNLIKDKKYNEAVTVLQNMLQKYPSGQFASNAHYWLGELYGLLGKNDKALNEFDTVIKSYPDSPRISDAQLKVGLIYASEFKWPEAKLAFKKVINRYPGTTSSRLAQDQLKQIKQAGH